VISRPSADYFVVGRRQKEVIVIIVFGCLEAADLLFGGRGLFRRHIIAADYQEKYLSDLEAVALPVDIFAAAAMSEVVKEA
jgi:hypothetical protein